MVPFALREVLRSLGNTTLFAGSAFSALRASAMCRQALVLHLFIEVGNRFPQIAHVAFESAVVCIFLLTARDAKQLVPTRL